MGAKDVTFTVGAKDAGFIKQFLDGQRAIDAMGKSLDIVASKAGKAQQATKGMTQGASRDLVTMNGQFANVASKFTGIGMALAGIASAAALFKAEYDRFYQTRSGAAQDQVAIQQAKERARASAGGSATLDQNEARLTQIRDKVRQPATGGWDYIAQGFGAAGDLPVPEILDAMEAVAEATGRMGDPATSNQAVVGLMGMMRARKPGDRDPKRLMGQLMGMFRGTVQVTPQDLFQNVVPGIVQAAGTYGDDIDSLTAYFGTMGAETMDQSGRVSSHAASYLMEAVRDAIVEHPRLKHDRTFQKQFQQMGWMERLAFIRSQDPKAKLGRSYLLGPSALEEDVAAMANSGMYGAGFKGIFAGETKTASASRAMLDPASPVNLYDKIKTTQTFIPGYFSPGALTTYQDFAGPRPNDPGTVYADRAAKDAATIRRAKEKSIGMATQGSAMDYARQMSDTYGLGMLDSFALRWATDTQVSSGKYSDDQVRRFATKYTRNMLSMRDDSPQNREHLAELDARIDELTQALKENTAATQGGQSITVQDPAGKRLGDVAPTPSPAAALATPR